MCCIFEVLNESWQTDIDYDNGAAEKKKLGRLLLCAGCTCKQTLQTLWMRLCMWYFTRSLSVGISYLFKHSSFENETRQVELKKNQREFVLCLILSNCCGHAIVQPDTVFVAFLKIDFIDM